MILLGVLASGGGTNLQALLDACASRRIDAEVALVLSNLPGAGALERAGLAGVASACLPSKGVADRAAYDEAVVARLDQARVDLVCLAGYMRLVTPGFLRAFGPSAASRGCPRVVNIHPALLPSFPGLHAWRAWVAQRRALLDEPAMVAALGEPAGGGRFEDSGGPKDRGG